MKVKNLRKKIRRLEARLQEGEKKLAKLKRKLEALPTAGAGKKKSAARAKKARPAVKSSRSVKPQVKPAGAPRRTKRKRKLNLSPERRAQLAAAMKARWAAKRAATEANLLGQSP